MLTKRRVTLAAEAQAVAIAELSRDGVEQGLGWYWTPGRVLQAILDPEVNVAVVTEQSIVLAFGIMRYEERHAHLELLAVHPSRRRRGLGSEVLKWLEQVARTAGMAKILVECRRSNWPARHFYHEHCYDERQIEAAMYRGIEDGVRLEKCLRPQGGASQG